MKVVIEEHPILNELFEEGRHEARQEGRQEGRQEEAQLRQQLLIESIHFMVEDGVPLETIAKRFHLTQEEVLHLLTQAHGNEQGAS